MLKFAAKTTLDSLRPSAYNKNVAAWLDRVEIPTIDVRNKTVVFNTVRAARNNSHLASDLFIGHLLARNGNRAYVLVDDGLLEHWDSVQQHHADQAPVNPMRIRALRAQLKRQVQKFADIFATDGLELVWYSDIVDKPFDEAVDEQLEAYARASTMRFFHRGTLNLDDAGQREFCDRSIRNAQVSRAVGRHVTETFKPDVFATSHGVYSTWGPAYQFVKGSGVSTKVYAVHPYRNGGLLIHDAPGGGIDRTALEQYLDSAQFEPSARAFAESYIQDRFSHKTTDTKEYFSELAKPATDRVSQIAAKSKDYDHTFGIFPNVAWDAIGDHLNGIYDNVIDWIVDTARCIGEDGRNQLIIRLHPAEATRALGTTPAYDLVKQALPEIDAYPNVEIVHPGEAVNSYDLLRECVDVALVYTGTLGAEAQILGIPVVPSAVGRFSHRFVTLPPNVPDYLDILRNPASTIKDFKQAKDEIVDSVLKYHYYFNEELYFPVGLFCKDIRLGLNRDLASDPETYDQSRMKKTLHGFVG